MAFSSIVDLSALDGSNGTIFQGIDAQDLSGYSVSNAGDVNGDGFDDILIGAYQGDAAGLSNSGESYLIFGQAGGFSASFDLSTLNGVNGLTFRGGQLNDNSGFSVSGAGDVNGDGYADLLIGAQYADPNGDSNAGETYVVFGAASGMGTGSVFDLLNLNGSNGFTIEGLDPADFNGSSVSSAGDVNGDGYDDILVGAFGANPNGNLNAGETYVIFGQAGGFSATFDPATLNGFNGFMLEGITAEDYAGFSVSSAGDINGDGYDDIIISAYRGDPNGNSAAGESYVIYGQGTIFAASLDLSTLNGTNGFTFEGTDAGDFSGYSVSNAGDINGDGYDDMLIGAYGGDPNGVGGAGETYVVFGQAAAFSASFDLSTLNGSNGFVLNGIAVNESAGLDVSNAGDINGDGYDDILISANAASPNGNSFAGETYVVFGQASGFTASFDLSTLNGSNGFTLQGYVPGSQSGVSVSDAGDVNGDGFGDLLIGAYLADVGSEANAGETYLYYGQAPTVAVTRTGSDADQMISGGVFGDTLYGMGGDDILSGGHGADTLDGGTGYDVASFNGFGGMVTVTLLNQGAAQATGPAGNDTLISIEGLSGGQFNDRLTGSTGDNTLDGLSGSDFLFGLGGADIMDGGAGNDNVQGGGGNDTLAGGDGRDTLSGGSGDDTLDGGAQNDQLRGGSSNDILIGGAGRDVLIGGDVAGGFPGDSAADIFVFNDVSDSIAGGATRDIIRDFEVGLDIIDLTEVHAFTYIGDTAFSGTAGELRSFIVGLNTVLRGDVDGDGIADFEVFLNGKLTLTGSDFFL